MENEVVEKPVEDQKRRSALRDTTQKAMFAAIGGVAIIKEELEGIINRMAERGELIERDARAHRQRAGEVASKEDITVLSAQVAELSRQLEEIKQTRAQKVGTK